MPAILFDFDDTLVETETLTYLAYKEELKNYLVEISEEEFMSKYKGLSMGDTKKKITEDYNVYFMKNFDENISKHIYSLMDDVGIRVKDGVVELIGSYPNKMAIVSNGRSERIMRALTITKLAPYFDPRFVFSAPEIARAKPDPSSIIYAVNKLGESLEDVVYVGDSINDAIAGFGAGVDTYILGAKKDWIEKYNCKKISSFKEIRLP